MTGDGAPPSRALCSGAVVCIGETMAALTPDPSGPLEAARRMRMSVAGAESNVAMYLAAHGVPVAWLSALGDDPLGRRVRDEVAAAGVDVRGVRSDPRRPTGLMVKDPGPDGTRVHYYRSGSAASALGPELLDDDRVRSASLLHLTGVTPALSASCRALVTQAFAPPADRRPYTVSFDVNHRPALWPPDTAATALRRLADRADITFVGLDEAQELWGRGLTAEGIRSLLPAPRVLVVKDGAHSATAFTDDGRWTVPALCTQVVEPVGAGDAFAAGFLSGLRRPAQAGQRPGERVVAALRLGHITAVSALRVAGDHGPLPDDERIVRLLGLSDRDWRTHASEPVHP